MKVIEVRKLSKYYQVYKRSSNFLSLIKSMFHRPLEEIRAVDDIFFEITEGELVGFIGPNGAGKTTTLKCLSGLLYPSSGQVSVLGFQPFERKTEFLRQISLVMGQKNQLWWDLPSMETFRLNKEIYELPEEEFEKTLKELAKLLEVEKLFTIPVRQLSLGQRMKMELIAALLHRPKVLFLDEPTIGLDVVMQKKIRDFILQYNKQFKATILLTSHYMADVKQLCKRVIIINRGKIVYDGRLESLIERYANYKMVTIVFNKTVKREELISFGTLQSFETDRAVILIRKELITNSVSSILRKLPIQDLTVQEPEIEDVIRLIFSK